MSKRIYVGNLPWSVTQEKLNELFSPFGDIEEALVIANKYTGRSRGFGFVTYKNDEDADKAMKEMNEKDLEGRKIVVKLARPTREGMQAEEKPEEKEPAEEKTPSKEEKKEKPKEEKPKKEKPAEEKEEK